MVSYRGQKKLGPSTDRSPLGFNSKFPTSIPTPFICGVPPSDPGTLSLFCKCEFTRYCSWSLFHISLHFPNSPLNR